MTKIVAPDDIIQELRNINQDSAKGIILLAEVERKAIELDLQAQTAEARALLESQGNIPERQAIALLKSEQERLQADIAKAEVSRVKTKLRHLQDQQSNLQTQARMVELTWRTAGVGER
jgi:hypothetical protein